MRTTRPHLPAPEHLARPRPVPFRLSRPQALPHPQRSRRQRCRPPETHAEKHSSNCCSRFAHGSSRDGTTVPQDNLFHAYCLASKYSRPHFYLFPQLIAFFCLARHNAPQARVASAGATTPSLRQCCLPGPISLKGRKLMIRPEDPLRAQASLALSALFASL